MMAGLAETQRRADGIFTKLMRDLVEPRREFIEMAPRLIDVRVELPYHQRIPIGIDRGSSNYSSPGVESPRRGSLRFGA